MPPPVSARRDRSWRRVCHVVGADDKGTPVEARSRLVSSSSKTWLGARKSVGRLAILAQRYASILVLCWQGAFGRPLGGQTVCSIVGASPARVVRRTSRTSLRSK